MRITEQFGEHGDVHTDVNFRSAVLRLTSGLYYSAKRQEAFAGGWTVRTWSSPDGERHDYRRSAAGKRSRYVALIPNGWVEYTAVDEATATAFDRVLDSICWKPLSNSR